jgi:nicotinate-nucleotide adenylyltransferase
MSRNDTSLRQCVAILGGSFDPVHSGHVAVAATVAGLLNPTQVRIIPSGWSWQKQPFHTSVQHRLAMLELAFKELANNTPLVIDEQEIKRAELGLPSYSFDTLSHLRDEFGAATSLVFIIGADQILQLQSWKNWEHLFDLAHIAVVTRPGIDLANIDSLVAYEFNHRLASIDQLRNRPFGHTYLCNELAVDISSTEIRHGVTTAKLPTAVLDYIEKNRLYSQNAQ